MRWQYHVPCFPCTWTSFQNRFFNDAEALDGFDDSSAFGAGAASFFCDEFSLNSSAGAGALGGGPWAVMGWATAAFKGEEWRRRSGAWHLATGKRRAENAARGIVAMTTGGGARVGKWKRAEVAEEPQLFESRPESPQPAPLQPRRLYYNTLDIYGSR